MRVNWPAAALKVSKDGRSGFHIDSLCDEASQGRGRLHLQEGLAWLGGPHGGEVLQPSRQVLALQRGVRVDLEIVAFLLVHTCPQLI